MEDRYQETFTTWDKVANLYADMFMDLEIYNESYDRFLDLVDHRETNILDVGCGPGNISNYLIKQSPRLNIHGIDISENMISIANKAIPQGKFTVMDIRNISLLDQKYQGIICGFCIPYLSSIDCKKLITDCATKLSSEGVLYLSFVVGHQDQSGYISSSTGDRTYFYYHTKSFITETLTDAGFQLLEWSEIEYQRSPTVSETHSVVMGKIM